MCEKEIYNEHTTHSSRSAGDEKIKEGNKATTLLTINTPFMQKKKITSRFDSEHNMRLLRVCIYIYSLCYNVGILCNPVRATPMYIAKEVRIDRTYICGL